MQSIVGFKIRVLEESLRVLFSNRIFVTASLNSKMLQLIFLILFRRVIWVDVSVSLPQKQRGLRQS